MNVMYLIYFSEERRRSGQNGTRPFGLLSQKAPSSVARYSFGFTKLRSSRRAWYHWVSNAMTWQVLTGPKYHLARQAQADG
jgi:hypothetical protein